MNIVDLVTDSLSYLTLASDIAITGFVLILALAYLSKKQLVFYKNPVVAKIINRGFLFAFIVATVATVGSLFYSEVAQYEPCKFCWFQRIFMYPLVLLLGMFLDSRDRKIIARPAMVLAIIGGIIALYHYYIQLSPASALVPCSAVGVSVSCTSREFTHLGYITIPMMSLTAFVLIILFLWLSGRTSKK